MTNKASYWKQVSSSNMSATVKYGSAFSPVIPSKTALNHPFSIRNLLSLDKQTREETAKGNRTIAGALCPYSKPRKADGRFIGDSVIAAEDLNVIATDNLWPAWVYATRYSRHGIPAGKLAFVYLPLIVRFTSLWYWLYLPDKKKKGVKSQCYEHITKMNNLKSSKRC